MCEPSIDSTPTQNDAGDLQKTVVALLISHSELAMGLPVSVSEPDPVLMLWVEWTEAHERLLELNRHQQRLETEMFATAGTPSTSPVNWDAADQRLGYSKARQAELEASAVEEALAGALWETPSRSVIGVIAKLQAIVCKGEPSVESEEYPWPELRSLMADMMRIGGRLAC